MTPEQSKQLWYQFLDWAQTVDVDDDTVRLNFDDVVRLVANKKWRKDGTLPRGFDRLHGDTTELEQTILTPDNLVHAVRDMFDGEIALDPCAAPTAGYWIAETNCEGPDHGGCNGLYVPWVDRTYVNPPYKHLKAWLAKALEGPEEGDVERDRLVVLCPVRPNRDWWQVAREAADVYVELGPIKFVGYKSAFPVPLCLMIWGVEHDTVRSCLEYAGVPIRRLEHS